MAAVYMFYVQLSQLLGSFSVVLRVIFSY